MTQPLSFFYGYRWAPFKWEIQRNDELSGQGSGRTISAELAPPLWYAQVSARQMPNSIAEELDTKIRSLGGAQTPFLMTSPLFQGPRKDPSGAILGSRTVSLASVLAGGTAVALQGMPAGYIISIGDKVQVQYGTSPDRFAFFEFWESGAANSSGITAQLKVYPPLPTGVSAGVVATILKPACRVFVVPDSYKVGQIAGSFTAGCSFQILQKK
jgi:hypothetical protein